MEHSSPFHRACSAPSRTWMTNGICGSCRRDLGNNYSLLLPPHVRDLLPKPCHCIRRPVGNVIFTSRRLKKHSATGLQSQLHKGSGAELGYTVKSRHSMGLYTPLLEGTAAAQSLCFPPQGQASVPSSVFSAAYGLAWRVLTPLFLLGIRSDSARKHLTVCVGVASRALCT